MDEHAKNADTAHEETFSDLTYYLSIMLPNDKHKQQLYLVRGLFVWLCHNRGNVVQGEKAGSDNPLQLLNAMASNGMDDEEAFQILCKRSGIACEVVIGTVRGCGDYAVGDVEPEHRHCWNVVRIDGTWRIINVDWAASTIEGYEAGGWTKKESDGIAVTEEIKPNTGRMIRSIKDFWFCPEPWEYIHYCYPDDPQWQLLPVKKQIKSVQEFLRLPMFTYEYFPLGLTLSTEQTCLLTVDGDTKEITFQMAVDRQGVAAVHLPYNLYVREDRKSSTDDIAERMVLNWHDGKRNTSSFELRFPVTGTYKLLIGANIPTDINNWMEISEFKIDCKRPTKNFRPLPIDAPYGWGCTYKAAEFGLVNPSLTSPKIPIEAADKNKDKSPNIASLVFTIKEDMVDSVGYKSYLYSRDHTEERHTALQKYVNTDVDARSLQLTVKASVPSAGEFALVIEASLTEKDGRTRESNVPVCSYLLTTLERSHELPRYRMNRKPRGYCLIINNRVFADEKKMPTRNGTNKDAELIEARFSAMNFVVVRKDNLADTDMRTFLEDMANTVDHSNFDCFVCCILTHGTVNSVYGSNGRKISITILTRPYQANRCKSLAGKPKLFFIQACQGHDEMGGVVEKDGPVPFTDAGLETDQPTQDDMIPNKADFLLAYATVPGYVSIRDTEHGTWYIRALCQMLERYAHSEDLVSILVKVNEEVSQYYGHLAHGGYVKQIPEPRITLRKKLFFS